MFHKRLFENILFPVDKCIGDSFTNYKLFMESCKTSYIHKDSYVHRIRKGSLTKPITEQLLSDTLEILLERIAILSLSGIDVTDENEILRNQLTFRLQQATEAGLESTDIYRRYREVLYLLE